MSDSGEKTEEPTGKKIQDARKKGQVPRSREAGTLFVLLSGVIAIWIFSSSLGIGVRNIMLRSFSLTREEIFAKEEMFAIFSFGVMQIAIPLICITAIMLLFAVIGNIMLGGFNFSQEAMMPKFSKLSPLKGIARIFSLNSVIELIKSILKVTFIGAFCYFILKSKLDKILSLSFINPLSAIYEAINLLYVCMLIIVLAMVPIVMIDVPFQIWNYKKQLRMTKQEIKDEYKEQEGNPQIKSKIRQMQYQVAARRMMQDVPTADVVVTNPTHYAVALKYDPDGPEAPIVVAKGIDEIAMKIKEIAYETNVPVLELPPLARSLYFTTDLKAEIPRGLFQAVAQVLAWVLGMKNFKEGKTPNKPRDLERNLPIPDELRF